jgi:hypothetical protein
MPDETCPQHEVLCNCLIGRLVAEAAKTLLDHLEDCPACQTKLQAVTDFGDASIDCVCQPWGQDDYQDEPQFQEAVTRAKAIRQTLPSCSPTGATSEANTDIIGQFDEYRILEKLGEGGMGSPPENGAPTGTRRIHYADAPPICPPGAPTGSTKIFRGGSTGHPSCSHRSAFRRALSPDYRYQSMGFRLAVVWSDE